jgi:hypothetical protein
MMQFPLLMQCHGMQYDLLAFLLTDPNVISIAGAVLVWLRSTEDMGCCCGKVEVEIEELGAWTLFYPPRPRVKSEAPTSLHPGQMVEIETKRRELGVPIYLPEVRRR